MSSVFDRMTTLHNWESGSRKRMKPELAPMVDLMLRLDSPHKAFRAVHVTGSKGKGSVCALIEAALHATGWKVGRYASPHLQCLSERIVVRRKPARLDQIEDALEAVLKMRDAAVLSGTPGAHSTWFDVMTAAAFVTFQRQGLDFAVIEAGLGGRLDSTNVVHGETCVITNISLEHCDVLGPTLRHVATEKAGIIKPGASVVTGVPPDSAAFEPIRAHAEKVGAQLCLVPARAGMLANNIALARAALDDMGQRGMLEKHRPHPLSGDVLTEALVHSARLPGRYEQLTLPAAGAHSSQQRIILDGAHTPQALDALFEELAAESHDLTDSLVAMLALSADKDAQGMLDRLCQVARQLVLVPLPDNRPCWPPTELAGFARSFDNIHVCGSVEEGVRASLHLANGILPILATGSLHLIAPARTRLLEATNPQAEKIHNQFR